MSIRSGVQSFTRPPPPDAPPTRSRRRAVGQHRRGLIREQTAPRRRARAGCLARGVLHGILGPAPGVVTPRDDAGAFRHPGGICPFHLGRETLQAEDSAVIRCSKFLTQLL